VSGTPLQGTQLQRISLQARSGARARGDLGCESCCGVVAPVPARARADRTGRFPLPRRRLLHASRFPKPLVASQSQPRRAPRTCAPAAELVRSLSSVQVSVIRLAGWRCFPMATGAAEQRRPASWGRARGISPGPRGSTCVRTTAKAHPLFFFPFLFPATFPGCRGR